MSNNNNSQKISEELTLLGIVTAGESLKIASKVKTGYEQIKKGFKDIINTGENIGNITGNIGISIENTIIPAMEKIDKYLDTHTKKK